MQKKNLHLERQVKAVTISPGCFPCHVFCYVFCYVLTSYFQVYELTKELLINSPSDNKFPQRDIEEMN